MSNKVKSVGDHCNCWQENNTFKVSDVNVRGQVLGEDQMVGECLTDL